MTEHIYKPLPSFLTIKESSIHGIGLFTKEDIQPGTLLGVSHIHSSLLHYDELDISFTVEEHKLKSYIEGNHLGLKLTEYKTVVFKDNIFPNSMIRTPLGGFINHSDNANCNFMYLNGGLWGVATLDKILANTELTLNYTYTPCGVIMK